MSIPVGTVVGDDRLSPCSGSSNSRRRGKWLALLLTLLLVTWFLSISYAVAGIEFSFSIGEGVNAYYLPTMNTFIYSGNEIYYEWSGDGWLYSRLRALVTSSCDHGGAHTAIIRSTTTSILL